MEKKFMSEEEMVSYLPEDFSLYSSREREQYVEHLRRLADSVERFQQQPNRSRSERSFGA